MATPIRLRSSAGANSSTVLVADVPWPRHKLFAVIAGLATLLLVGMVTASAAPAVLGGAGVGIMVAFIVRALEAQ